MAQTREAVREQDLAQARKTIEDLKAQREDIDRQIHEASAIIRGWEAFDLAVQGKLTLPGEAAPAQTAEPKTRKATGTRAKPGELGGFRKEVYDFVKQHPKGLEAGDVQAHFNPRKDKKLGAKVGAALYKLKDVGALEQPSGGRGPYVAVVTSAATTPKEEAPALAEQEAE
jgi:hypothetical protein